MRSCLHKLRYGPDVETVGSISLHYEDYLKIPQLLDLQRLRSAREGDGDGSGAHDEHLFIIIHQVYELWFKEIIHEIDSVTTLMGAEAVDGDMFTIISRLNRVSVIVKILVEQIRVLETMTPLDFLDFRHLLSPASGYQSLQFRLIEVKLGVKESARLKYGDDCTFRTPFEERQDLRQKLETACRSSSLFDAVEQWLTRWTVWEEGQHVGFWEVYRESVGDILAAKQTEIENEERKEVKKLKEEDLVSQKTFFNDLLDESKHEQHVEKGNRRLSHQATRGALMISQYRDEPCFQSSYQVLCLLMDIDSQLMHWRHNHSLFVQRMIGHKVGTAGSSGYRYLKETVSDRYRVFSDLFNLSSYIIPRKHIRQLALQ
ncbi:tryptophan 2,3-dioxygenase-like isoform X2 [Corticium candelabrum]|uniref:tryptophan 2,3-dioxygenase-like isoform X2 n=1 Tax=Corticium candelabrum TaxID=121492 RepID=UPI002E254880|nr:tryptophan 2,3-dioxygenase-like isoform X2 [Corticium candelabrum]